jgi:two-component system phosphate regulon response regulator PhoB
VRAVLSAGVMFGLRFWPVTSAGAAGAPTGGRDLPTVLVAGGDPRQCQELGRCLRRSGFRLRAVPDGPSALAAASEAAPAAAVLEWIMPGAGGAEVCARLRRHPTLYRVPVVLITARGDGAQVAEGFRAGANEVLTQGFEPDELVRFLERGAVGGGR